MLPFGHLAAGYLIAQIPVKKQLSGKELLIVLSGTVIYDFDYLVPKLIGWPPGTHHFLPTHTPLFGLIYLLVVGYLTRKWLERKVLILLGLSLLSHLVLDDLSYWFYLWGWDKATIPQIFWAYPFDPRRDKVREWLFRGLGNGSIEHRSALEVYLVRQPLLFYAEIILVMGAILVMAVKHRPKRVR
jgi:hypothetical protein